MSNIIQVTGLKKTFRLSARQQKLERTNSRLKVAVNDLSFSANEGEIFGLLGANGAGKTTTLRMLATLIRPDEGTAVLDGADIVAEPERVRRKIGFLTGELKLEEYFTPNYLFDFFCELHGVPENLRAERKRMLFEKFGIDSFAEVKVGNLSTGMKQKVSLVIALVHDPKIIIFDEPTNGLDVLTAKVCRNGFSGGAARAGENGPVVDAYLQPGGKALRPRRYHHRRKNGGRGGAAGDLRR